MNTLNDQENKMYGKRRNETGMPTIFDIFSRPLTEFGSMFTPLADENLKIDVQDLDDHYQIKADMPGVKKEDIRLDFDDGVLTLTAEHHKDAQQNDEQHGYVIRERSFEESFFTAKTLT